MNGSYFKRTAGGEARRKQAQGNFEQGWYTVQQR